MNSKYTYLKNTILTLREGGEGRCAKVVCIKPEDHSMKLFNLSRDLNAAHYSIQKSSILTFIHS